LHKQYYIIKTIEYVFPQCNSMFSGAMRFTLGSIL